MPFLLRRERRLRALVLACAMLVAGAGSTRADTYGFDKQHTNILFSWDHLGISRQHGRVMSFDGTVEFDPAAPEQGSVDVTMKVASIWTGADALDRLLRTADYFDAETYPTMTFKSTAVRKTGEKTGEVTGDLTIMGFTQPATLQVTWNFTGEHPLARLNPLYLDKTVSGFTAQTRILRSAFGIKRGTPLASDEIDIVINAELIKREK